MYKRHKHDYNKSLSHFTAIFQGNLHLENDKEGKLKDH